MDLRDQIAIAALQGLLANPNNWMAVPEVLSEAAYKHADAMIAEREKGSVDSVTSAKAQLIQAIEWEHNITVNNGEFLCIKHLIEYLRSGFKPEVGEK